MSKLDTALKQARIKVAATYPWPECIADQKKDGKSDESANKICGSIKAKSQG